MFGDAGQSNLAFVWWDGLFLCGGHIAFLNKAPDTEADLRRKGDKNGATQAKEFDRLINRCFLQKQPLRVALVANAKYDETHGEAAHRVLDPELWYPHHIDHSVKRIVVLRGVPQPADYDPSDDLLNGPLTGSPTAQEASPASSSQSSEPLEPETEDAAPQPEPPPVRDRETGDADRAGSQTQIRQTTTYTRDPEVAKEVKRRAKDGRCEYCGEQGFQTIQGGYFLESHHVIPRNCDGPDRIWVVAAVCPDCHKRAHYGADRIAIRDKLIDMLGQIYPEWLHELRRLAAKMDGDLQAERKLEETFDN